DIEVLKKFDAEVKGIIDFIKLQDLELHDDYYGSVTSGKVIVVLKKSQFVDEL
ncbi:15166_t:CDS:1, partial [Entrophospora sp. SA101]